MLYFKGPLTLEQQADRLIQRGLIADKAILAARLKVVNYYRLCVYLVPFRDSGDNYRAGTTLENVWRRYNFDRRLRTLILDAVERIEVAVRTSLVYHFVNKYGAFGHTDPRNLPKMAGETVQLCACSAQSGHDYWLGKLRHDKNRAIQGKHAGVLHFDKKYGSSHTALPLWVACELMSCETVQRLLRGVPDEIIRLVGADFGFPDEWLRSWCKALFSLRNTCAHHDRLINRTFGLKLSMPGKNKFPDWHNNVPFISGRTGHLMTATHFWLGKITATSTWRDRVFRLFDEYAEIQPSDMGFNIGWQDHPLWS